MDVTHPPRGKCRTCKTWRVLHNGKVREHLHPKRPHGCPGSLRKPSSTDAPEVPAGARLAGVGLYDHITWRA